mgnify:CR=1 FL=1|tara:strand:+ start:3451 stop:4284 length:834 start_codon:yes stop_codon:yes gene_type:complete
MVLVQLTNGFGNNLFQYNAARLLAEYHNQDVYAIPPSQDYYAVPCLKKLGIKFFDGQDKVSSLIGVNDANYNYFFDKQFLSYNFMLNGYFEDYTYYKEHIQDIKKWYPKVNKRGNNDLVIHFRAGDRLFYKNEFDSKPSVKSYLKAIEQFDFEDLHIVTDMPKWEEITELDLAKMKFHKDVPKEQSVAPADSVRYFNSFVEGLSKYNPTVKKRTVGEDFEFIRTFNNILFQHGTLGWWAAALSEAQHVGVYGPWRPWKAQSNKNLSEVGLEGWFKWK